MSGPVTDRRKGILITGATGALGRAVVRRFQHQGWKVHGTWVREGELESFEEEIPAEQRERVCLHKVDLADGAAVEDLFREIEQGDGGLDAVANIAGGFLYAPLEETGLDEWQRMLAMNATSAFLCCRAGAALMKKTAKPGKEPGGAGRLINVAAMPALARGAAQMCAYAASKAAVWNLTQSLAEELAPHRITVNAIVPSIIDTPANRRAMPDSDTSKWLQPAEIAEVVDFLAGDAGGIVSGSALVLSRG